MFNIQSLSPDRPVLIAGPTASGKSALAARIVGQQGGVVVNADALQVYDGWRLLTARPSVAEETALPHALYGHVARGGSYSVGDWLRDVAPFLDQRPVIVGGTGLYFSALTQGLAAIPATPPEVRAQADGLPLPDLIAALDAETAAGLDLANRARVQRAWEVQRATGRPITYWQAQTGPAALPLTAAQPLVIDAPKDWLTPRIAQRFDLMLDHGLLDEARAMADGFDPAHPSSKAIGARESIAHVRGDLSLNALRDAVVIGSRQYAKRQRSWFRSRMADWRWIPGAA